MPDSDGWVPEPREGNASDEWQSKLIRETSSKGRGQPKAVLANAITAMRYSPALQGAIAFNEFSFSLAVRRDSVLGKCGTEWTDHEDRIFAEWLQHHSICVGVEIAGQAAQVVGRDCPFHPVREYLRGLQWDGVPRIGGWLSLYLGAQPSDYTEAVGSRWLRSAVARVFRPGCKADCCLILEGKQGLKKSTALRTLGEPWFTDDISDLGSKDSALQARGVLLVEIPELDAMKKPEVARVKAYMSRAVDRFRPPYGRHLIQSPRQCVFAGSVNHSTYFQDETGARRFWPVACTRVLIDELARDRDQLWAEAFTSYGAGAAWWLDSDELIQAAEGEQSQRYEEGSWDDLIATWAVAQLDAGESSISIPEVLENCIKKRACDWTRADEMRVSKVLKFMRWERFRFRDPVGGILRWRYRPVPDPPAFPTLT